MVKSTKISYFLSIFILRFILIHTQGQNETVIKNLDDYNENSTLMITYEESINSTTIIINTTIESTTISKTIYQRLIPPINLTWILIGGFTGGLTAIVLLGIIISVYICFENSRTNFHSEITISNNEDNVPLYTISTF